MQLLSIISGTGNVPHIQNQLLMSMHKNLRAILVQVHTDIDLQSYWLLVIGDSGGTQVTWLFILTSCICSLLRIALVMGKATYNLVLIALLWAAYDILRDVLFIRQHTPHLQLTCFGYINSSASAISSSQAYNPLTKMITQGSTQSTHDSLVVMYTHHTTSE